jgi:hypothetical protein
MGLLCWCCEQQGIPQLASGARLTPAGPALYLCLFLWGAVSRVQARFNAFIRTFKENGADEDCKYMQLLQEVRRGSSGGGAVVAAEGD